MRGIIRTMIVSAAAAVAVVGLAAMASAHDGRGHDGRGWGHDRHDRWDKGRWEYVAPKHHHRHAHGWGPPPVVFAPRPVVIPQPRPLYVAPTPSFNIVVPLTIR